MLRGRGHARGGIVLSCTAIVSALAMVSAASAAEFNWAQPTGLSPGGGFSYSTGKNIGVANLYGEPTILNVGFDFNSTQNFQALGGGGSAGLANNIASTVVIAQGLGSITQIRIQEFGTWSAPGLDPASLDQATLNSFFPFTGILGLQPISPGGAQQFSNFSSSIVFNPDGTWTAEGTLIPATSGGSFFNIGAVTANNELRVSASSAAPAGSTFEKLGSMVVVPEPTTIVLLLAGLAPLSLRRRRRS